jgi:hypothetical protein
VQAWFDPDSFRRFGRNEWPYYDGVPDRDPMGVTDSPQGSDIPHGVGFATVVYPTAARL